MTTAKVSPGLKAQLEGVYTDKRMSLVAPMIRDVAGMVKYEAGSYALAMPMVAHILKDHAEWDREDLVRITTHLLIELARVHDGHPIVTREIE